MARQDKPATAPASPAYVAGRRILHGIADKDASTTRAFEIGNPIPAELVPAMLASGLRVGEHLLPAEPPPLPAA